ncbi:MAG TPA: type III polyketide synthase [Ktedonobacterales bacterium]|nr:type III polyketide synthase [Ktedonobacterales bacterium]
MNVYPRILALASALPPTTLLQDEILEVALAYLLGAEWRERPEALARAKQIERLFRASRVERRQVAVAIDTFYDRARSTGERMAAYQPLAAALGAQALEEALRQGAGVAATDISDVVTVSCTGYGAPGLDVAVARDLGLARDVRRLAIGHMGCYGALVGLRQAAALARAEPAARVAVLSVELTSLHFAATADQEVLTSFALFGDAAAAALIGTDEGGTGPQLVGAYSMADFDSAGQMAWTIGDQGFVMGLSPRVPVTLRRHVSDAVARLLAPHGLTAGDVAHWIIHPGGPSILQAIQGRLGLSDDQMRPNWQVLAEHGNCSSATVLLILERLLREERTRPGEWGVMMAFGPGLTLETILLRF